MATKKITLNELKSLVNQIIKEQEEQKYLDRNDILNAIKSLSRSQGSYGRMLSNLEDIKRNDPDKYERIMTNLENEKFSDIIDFVMFIET